MVPLKSQILANSPQSHQKLEFPFRSLWQFLEATRCEGESCDLRARVILYSDLYLGGKKPNKQTPQPKAKQKKKPTTKKLHHHQKAQNFPFTFAGAASFSKASQGCPSMWHHSPPARAQSCSTKQSCRLCLTAGAKLPQLPNCHHRSHKVMVFGIWMVLKPFYSAPCFQC